MRTSLFAVLLLFAPLASPEALPPPVDTAQTAASSTIETIQGVCVWMLTQYDCILVQRGKQVFLIYRDEKGVAYQWEIDPDGKKIFKWARDDISL